MIGKEQTQGIADFEKLCREERHRGRLGECETLIGLCREYNPVLSQTNTGIVLYHEAKLWFDRREWSQAEDLFRKLTDNPALAAEYHVKAWNRIGLLYAVSVDGKRPIDTLEQATALAKDVDYTQLAFVLHDLGAVYRDSGDTEQGRHLLEKSIALATAANNVSCIVPTTTALERWNGKLGKFNVQ